jgi:hypothetical protein
MTYQIEDTKRCHEKMEQEKERICEWIDAEIIKGSDFADAKGLMYAADIVKDLSEAQKNVWESCYYKSVVEAMDEYDYYPENRRKGYRPGKEMRHMYPAYSSDYNYPQRYEDNYDDEGEREYGREFNNFRKAKKHYTQTHSPEDQQRMKEHANKHLAKTITTLKEIWKDADPDLRRKMKADFSNLVNEMAV